MTRDEQIEQAWFCKACLSNHCYDEKSFKEAVEWADKTMIDKARDWLQCIDFEVEYFTIDSDGYTFFNADKFIEDFCKAMKEQYGKRN